MIICEYCENELGTGDCRNCEAYTEYMYDEWNGAQDAAWHRIEIYGDETGARAYHSTNDDRDLGYPDEYASWEITYASLSVAERVEGKSRQGTGCKVEVFVNGMVTTS